MAEERKTEPLPSVLFVCTANQIRSPMAVAMFRQMLQQCDPQWKKWRIESAGTWAPSNQPPLPSAQMAMSRRNLDISQHRSRMVSRELLSEFRLILTMEAGHKEALQVEFPEIAQRVFMLSEMTGVKKNIADPIGGQPDLYEKTAAVIETILQGGCQRIIELSHQ